MPNQFTSNSTANKARRLKIARARALWEGSNIPVTHIAKTVKCTTTSLYNWSRRYGWVRNKPSDSLLDETSTAADHKAATEPQVSSIVDSGDDDVSTKEDTHSPSPESYEQDLCNALREEVRTISSALTERQQILTRDVRDKIDQCVRQLKGLKEEPRAMAAALKDLSIAIEKSVGVERRLYGLEDVRAAQASIIVVPESKTKDSHGESKSWDQALADHVKGGSN